MDVSIIIPTYNRPQELQRTLNALTKQSFEGSSEVLVVDDGSSPEVSQMLLEFQKTYPLPLHYFYQVNRKQGAARNLGARNARGKLLVFLGDDTAPISSFLTEHYHSHETHQSGLNEGKTTVVIGYTTWPDEFEKSTFLEYIGEQGWQFGFSLIDNPGNVPFNYFYTSNLSIRRDFFLESGGFDESFQEYGWEDIELSRRLKAQGMRIVYNSRAKAFHYHVISIETFIERQRRVGFSAWTFYRKHPDMKSFLGLDRIPDYTLWEKLRMAILTRLAIWTEGLSRPRLDRFYPDLMSYHYMLGVLEGRREASA